MITAKKLADMVCPVQCAHCGGHYDLTKIRVIHHWIDGKEWLAPCCGTLVDDRGETGWKAKSDYKRKKRHEIFPCDRCSLGWTDYMLCTACRVGATKALKADEKFRGAA